MDGSQTEAERFDPAEGLTDPREAEFIRIIAEGGTWKTAQEELGVSSATLSKWLRESPELEKQYAHAREAQGDIYADRVIETAEDRTLDPQEKRVRMDAYKWAAGKRKPKVYGDRLVHAGDEQAPIKHEIDHKPQDLARALLAVVARAETDE